MTCVFIKILLGTCSQPNIQNVILELILTFKNLKHFWDGLLSQRLATLPTIFKSYWELVLQPNIQMLFWKAHSDFQNLSRLRWFIVENQQRLSLYSNPIGNLYQPNIQKMFFWTLILTFKNLSILRWFIVAKTSNVCLYIQFPIGNFRSIKHPNVILD